MDIDLTPTGECWEDALLLGIDLHNQGATDLRVVHAMVDGLGRRRRAIQYQVSQTRMIPTWERISCGNHSHL